MRGDGTKVDGGEVKSDNLIAGMVTALCQSAGVVVVGREDDVVKSRSDGVKDSNTPSPPRNDDEVGNGGVVKNPKNAG